MTTQELNDLQDFYNLLSQIAKESLHLGTTGVRGAYTLTKDTVKGTFSMINSREGKNKISMKGMKQELAAIRNEMQGYLEEIAKNGTEQQKAMAERLGGVEQQLGDFLQHIADYGEENDGIDVDAEGNMKLPPEIEQEEPKMIELPEGVNAKEVQDAFPDLDIVDAKDETLNPNGALMVKEKDVDKVNEFVNTKAVEFQDRMSEKADEMAEKTNEARENIAEGMEEMAEGMENVAEGFERE